MEVEIGKVSAFFAKPLVAGIDVTGQLKVGDRLHIKGHTTDLELSVDSMQIEGAAVTAAKVGDAVGVQVPDRVRPGDTVYKVSEE